MSNIKREKQPKMGFLKGKWKYWKNTESEYFERTTVSLLQREQNNMIKEKPKNKRGKYNKTNEKKNAKQLNQIQ